MKPTINQGKHSGEFDTDRLAHSLEQACYSVGTPEGSASDIAKQVVKTIDKWLEGKPEVTDDDIRRKAGEHLERLCPEAGYLYKNQKSIL